MGASCSCQSLDQSSALAQSGFQLAPAQETSDWCGPDRSPSLPALDSQTIMTPCTVFYQGINQHFLHGIPAQAVHSLQESVLTKDQLSHQHILLATPECHPGNCCLLHLHDSHLHCRVGKIPIPCLSSLILVLFC